MKNHNPTEITCPFPPDRGAGGVSYIPKSAELQEITGHIRRTPAMHPHPEWFRKYL